MKGFIVFLMVLVLAGCQSPTSPKASDPQATSDPPVAHIAIVKDSLWRTVKTVTLDAVARSASNPTYAEIQAEIDADNALALTSQEWVYLDTAPDISNAPNGNVFYCNPITGVPNVSYLNLTRQYIFDHYQEFLDGAHGQLVYVDHIPPAPVLAKDSTPYEWYSMYLIEDEPTAGTIIYEDHAGYNKDETWSGQWITTPIGQFYNGTPGGGWATVDSYYDQTLSTYRQIASTPWIDYPGVTKAHLVTRELYPPLPTK